jgi:hypothetical protein
LPQTRGDAPSFIVWAAKDPADGNLDRIQIVKGWTKNGQIFEKIYDVAWSGDRQLDATTGALPDVGNTVDIAQATYTNDIGAVELQAVWSDPEFDPSLHAFYYARALQIPTPRWNTFDAVKLGIVPPSNAPTTVQERAWSTPIWYAPGESDRANAPVGTLVADLLKSGAVVLDENALKALVVGKNLKVTNTVTGETATVLFGDNGQRVESVWATDAVSGSQVVEGSSADYEIKDGRIVTTLGGTPIEITVYQSGDTYLASRSNEFGFANYQFESLAQ